MLATKGRGRPVSIDGPSLRTRRRYNQKVVRAHYERLPGIPGNPRDVFADSFGVHGEEWVKQANDWTNVGYGSR